VQAWIKAGRQLRLPDGHFTTSFLCTSVQGLFHSLAEVLLQAGSGKLRPAEIQTDKLNQQAITSFNYGVKLRWDVEIRRFAGLHLSHPLPRCVNVCNSRRGTRGGRGFAMSAGEGLWIDFSSGIFLVMGGVAKTSAYVTNH
jgi:hypothetical protein